MRCSFLVGSTLGCGTAAQNCMRLVKCRSSRTRFTSACTSTVCGDRGGFVIAGRSPADGEAAGYLLMFWGSLAALGLAAVSAVGLFVIR